MQEAQRRQQCCEPRFSSLLRCYTRYRATSACLPYPQTTTRTGNIVNPPDGHLLPATTPSHPNSHKVKSNARRIPIRTPNRLELFPNPLCPRAIASTVGRLSNPSRSRQTRKAARPAGAAEGTAFNQKRILACASSAVRLYLLSAALLDSLRTECQRVYPPVLT